MMLKEFLGVSEESVKLIESQFDSDTGEMVYDIDENGIYIMDITVDINHYTMIPISKTDFINMMMSRIVNKLNDAAKSYYNNSKEIMSNKEYDNLYDGLERFERETGIILEESPTQRVGFKESSSLADVIHEYPAKSLDKTKDIKEYAEAFKKAMLETKATGLLWVTPKMDGITIVATYKGGRLVLLATRGNGEVGKDITAHAPFIKGLPMRISYTGKLIVRGEAVMSYSEFERINAQIPEEGQKYKNPRNLASGTINQPETKDIREREILFFAFNLVFIEDEYFVGPFEMMESLSTFKERMAYLFSLGFNTVKRWSATCTTLDSVVEEVTEQVLKEDYPVDGLVTVMDDLKNISHLSDTGHHPNRAKGFAFKWADEEAETVLKEIEWSASRTGLLNPVAVFDPVELCGTTVSRASLHNLSYISDMDLRIGDKITVYKANMIIPQIAGNLDKGTDRYCINCHNRLTDDDIDWEPDGDCSCRFCRSKITSVKVINSYITINKCPVCGGSIGIEETEGGTFNVRCTNPWCGAKKVGEIVHFCERDCMDIKGLSEKKVEFLVNNGYISGIYDLLNFSYMPFGIQSLDRKKFLSDEEGWDRKSEANLWSSIDKALDTDFVSFIHAMGIANVGKGQAKELKKYLDSNYDNLAEEYNFDSDSDYDLIGLLTVMVAGGFNFTQVDGFGDVIARSLFNWVENNLVDPVRQYLDLDNDPACEVMRILEMLRFHDERVMKSSDNAIAGKTFVITGSLNHYKNRDELVGVIESLGGKVSGSVSKNTDYLINNDVNSTSGKNKKARELGVPIISEVEFVEVI